MATIGQSASVSVTASGTAPLAYQWLKDGVWLPGQTNSSVSFASFQFTNSGSYRVVITNTQGMMISRPASLSVTHAPLQAWGYNGEGELGKGTSDNTSQQYGPESVASNVVAAAAGEVHSLFVKADGTLWAMGYNYSGQLGNGTTNDSSLPVSVASSVAAVAAGGYHSLFVKADGTLWAMGRNNYGQLGNGTTNNSSLPVSVASSVVAVAAGIIHSLFVKADGTLWAMGWNGYGQLGNGTTTSTNRPVVVASNVVAVAGGLHSLFVKADGTLWAMGNNGSGQLGNGNNSHQNSPVSVASNVVAVAAGVAHSLFVKADGTLWAMGYNRYGQLGNGNTVDTNLPVMNMNVFSVASLGAMDCAHHSLAVATAKTLATVTLSNLTQTYDGTAKPVSVVTAPTNLTVSVTYNGSASASASVGRHTVVGTVIDSTYYGSAAATLVIRTTPTVTNWPAASAIFHGQTLASSALSGGSASVAGTFGWTTPGTAPGVGTTSQGVTFTPADAVLYDSVTGGVNVAALVPPTVTTVAANGRTPGGATLNAVIHPEDNLVDALFQYATSTNFAGGTIVSTLAGSGQFSGPWGVAVDASGTVYVADTVNNRIRKVTAAGEVTTLAGSGEYGNADGTGTAAQFDNPSGVAVDADGTVYVADTGNYCIRKVTAAGEVTTLAGPDQFNSPQGVAVDASGTVYVADVGVNCIFKVTAAGDVTTLSDQFYNPYGVAVDASGTVYVADSGNNRICMVTAEGEVTTLAGSGEYGNADGTGTAAQFAAPMGVAVDASGNVYVADSDNHCIRKVTAAGVVTTLAGSSQGSADGPAATARFNWPSGVAVDASGTVYVADYNNSLIRKITSLSTVSLLAQNGLTGTAGVNVSLSVTGLAAQTTYYFRAVATNNVGSVYGEILSFTTLDANATVAAVVLTNLLQTYDGTAKTVAVTTSPTGLAVDVTYNGSASAPVNAGSYAVVASISDASYYGSATNTLVISKATPTVTTWPTASAIFYGQTLAASTLSGGSASVAGAFAWTTPATAPAVGASSQSVTFTPAEALDYNSVTGAVSVVAVVLPTVTTVAASGLTSVGAMLNATINPNGTPVNALFQYATSTNFAGGTIVSTLAGSLNAGYIDGTGTAAQFTNTYGVAVDASGNVYVADSDNHCIRKVTAAGVVTTLAGFTNGNADGTGTEAQFALPQGVAVDASGTVYVADTGNNCIRKVTAAGVVTTLAGSNCNYADGTGTEAWFAAPAGVAVDAGGTIYVADTGNNCIRMVTPAGVVTTLAGSITPGYADDTGAAALFRYPSGVAVDAGGNVYVADTGNNCIRMVTPAGVVTTLAGSTLGEPGYFDGTGTAAQFANPSGVAVDAGGNVYAADGANNCIRKVTATGVVTTLAGSTLGEPGYFDGTGAAAQFSCPFGVAVDASGNIYVSDMLNTCIRLIVPVSAPTILAQSGLTGTASVNVSLNVTGLALQTTYYYRALATNSFGTVFGQTLSFTTLANTLEIHSAYGMGTPAVGSYTNAFGSILTNSMANPEPMGGTQYVCTGWSMAGSDPASGTTTQCVMTATNEAVLTWLWATNVTGTPLWWLAQHGLPQDFEAAARHDADRDGMTDASEYIAGTDPTNATSLLGFTAHAPYGSTDEGPLRGITWHFPAVEGRVYDIEAVNDLGNHAGWALLPGATNLTGFPTIAFTNLFSQAAGKVEFYRISVRLKKSGL